MIDKRRCFRFAIELPVWFKNTRYQKNLSMATTINISGTGMCISTREPLEVGQEVMMQVTLPPDEKIIIRAHVVWVREIPGTIVREYQAGIRISEPMQLEERKFIKFCARKMLEFYHQHSNSSS